MRQVIGITLALVVLSACGSNSGDEPGPSSTGALTTVAESPEVSTGSFSPTHPCQTMVVDPGEFVSETYPELVEAEREDFDADWLRADGAVGCLVSLTPPGEDFRAVGVEGYVFDASLNPPQELIDTRVSQSAFVITSAEVTGLAGAVGLLREGADVPYAIAAESSGLGVFVQTSSSDAGVEALISIATSILNG